MKLSFVMKYAVLVRENMKKHDPKSPFLTGNSLSDDVIHEAEQKSWLIAS